MAISSLSTFLVMLTEARCKYKHLVMHFMIISAMITSFFLHNNVTNISSMFLHSLLFDGQWTMDTEQIICTYEIIV